MAALAAHLEEINFATCRIEAVVHRGGNLAARSLDQP